MTTIGPLTGSLSPLGTRRAAAVSFLPTDIAGLLAWWDYSDLTKVFQDAARTTPVTADGDVIGGIADQSGANNHVGQALTSSKPIWKANIQNGRGVGLFDGLDDRLLASFTLGNPMTVYAVFSPVTWTNLDFMWSGTAANEGALQQSGTTPSVRFRGSSISLTTNVFTLGAFHVARAEFSGITSKLDRNGVNALSADTGTVTAGGFTMGSSFSGGNYGNVYFGEVLIYSGAITDARVLTYLNSRWAVY